MSANMKLFHVIAADYDGTPHGNDLYVYANTPKQAVKLWQKYYDVEGDGEEPETVDEIPACKGTKPYVIPWSGVDSPAQVWVSKAYREKCWRKGANEGKSKST